MLKRKLSNLVVILLALIASGCGIQKATEDTRDLVDVSNTKQQGILDSIREMLNKTGELVTASHLQVLDTAMKNMLNAPQTNFLNPPMLMLMDADAYATAATEKELVLTEYVLFQTAQLPAMGVPQSDKQLETRAAAYAAFTTLAAMTPAEKATAILKSLNDPKQEYPDLVVNFAAARYTFTRDVLFNPALKSKIISQGVIERIVTRFEAMKEIAQMPEAAQLSYTIDIKNILPKYTAKIDSAETVAKLGQQMLTMLKTKAPQISDENHDLLRALELN